MEVRAILFRVPLSVLRRALWCGESMKTQRDIHTTADVTLQELVTALKLRFPGNIHIETLPASGKGVTVSSQGSAGIKVSYTKTGDVVGSEAHDIQG